jgi:glycosyltransferase involved in cell wall biosynthesis
MKILIAVHHFPPKYTGGAEWEAFHMAAALLSRGHAVKVVCVENVNLDSTTSLTWADELFEGIPVRRLSFNRASIPDPVRWEYDNLWIGQHFDHFFNEYKPDIFHLISGYLMSGSPIWSAYAHAIPSVVSLEDFWFLCPRITLLRSDGKLSTIPIDPFVCANCLAGEKRRFKIINQVAPDILQSFWHLQKSKAGEIEARTKFLNRTLNKADRLIVRSKFLTSTYIQAGAPSEKMIFSRQGLDFPTRLSEEIEKPVNQPLRVGYLGQIAWHKGIHVLSEAVRRLPTARLEVKIFGNSERFPRYTAQLERIIADDQRISLAGTYNGYEDESRVLSNLDVVVVPSLWYENSPNVILESFAQKVPVITSNLGGMAEMVQHEKDGLLFKAGSSEDLARQLQRLCTEPDLLPRLKSGIAPVKSVSEEIDELEFVYQSLLAGDRFPQLSFVQELHRG